MSSNAPSSDAIHCQGCGAFCGQRGDIPQVSRCEKCPPKRCDQCADMDSLEAPCRCWRSLDGMAHADVKALFARAAPDLSLGPPRQGDEMSGDRLPDCLSVPLPEIDRERTLGWPNFHPEDFCHRCGGRNIYSWHAPNDVWNRVVGDRWNGIVCPQCFTELAREVGVEPTVWVLRDGDQDRRP